jgi:hypothetical protein
MACRHKFVPHRCILAWVSRIPAIAVEPERGFVDGYSSLGLGTVEKIHSLDHEASFRHVKVVSMLVRRQAGKSQYRPSSLWCKSDSRNYGTAKPRRQSLSAPGDLRMSGCTRVRCSLARRGREAIQRRCSPIRHLLVLDYHLIVERQSLGGSRRYDSKRAASTSLAAGPGWLLSTA